MTQTMTNLRGYSAVKFCLSAAHDYARTGDPATGYLFVEDARRHGPYAGVWLAD